VDGRKNSAEENELTRRRPSAFSVQSRRTDQNPFILMEALEF